MVVSALEKLEARLLDVVAYLPLLGIALLIFLFFLFLSRVVARQDRLFEKLSPNPFLRDLGRQAVRSAVLIAGILLALEVLDATALVGAVLGTAGVVGLAVGFAFRDLVENYIASVLLSLRQPFAPNDFVQVGEHSGKVIRLTSRATVLMTLDGNHLRIPNADVFKGVVLNYTRNPLRRFDFAVGVGAGDDLVEARRLGLEVLREMPGVVVDPAPSAMIEELGDSSVLFRFYGWIDQREVSLTKVKGEAIRLVKTALEDAAIDLPEPIYRVRIEGDRIPVAETVPAPRKTPKRRVASPLVQEDVSADNAVDGQIAAERSAGDEWDLLDESAPRE